MPDAATRCCAAEGCQSAATLGPLCSRHWCRCPQLARLYRGMAELRTDLDAELARVAREAVRAAGAAGKGV